jgi:hypothetical protein
MSDDVVSQVRAAIQERRSSAEAAAAKHGAKWRYREATNGGVVEGTVENRSSGGMPDVALWDSEGGYLATTEDAARHIATNDPASVLRLCDGLEAILDRHRNIAHKDDGRYACEWCGHYGDGSGPCPDVLSVASMLGVGETQ